MAGFPKFSHVDLHVPGAYGVRCAFCATGAFSAVVPSVHNGSAIWLSSLFSERFSESGRSNLGSGSCTLLDEAYLNHAVSGSIGNCWNIRLDASCFCCPLFHLGCLFAFCGSRSYFQHCSSVPIHFWLPCIIQ